PAMAADANTLVNGAAGAHQRTLADFNRARAAPSFQLVGEAAGHVAVADNAAFFDSHAGSDFAVAKRDTIADFSTLTDFDVFEDPYIATEMRRIHCYLLHTRAACVIRAARIPSRQRPGQRRRSRGCVMNIECAP